MLPLDSFIQICVTNTNSYGPIWLCYQDHSVDKVCWLFMIPSLTICDGSFFTLSLMETGIHLGGCMNGVTEEPI